MMRARAIAGPASRRWRSNGSGVGGRAHAATQQAVRGFQFASSAIRYSMAATAAQARDCRGRKRFRLHRRHRHQGRHEPCSDKLYTQRHALLNESAQPMIVSLAGSDWSACINSSGRSNAIERLNRLRELFYVDGESLGARHLTVTRLSSNAKFRSYAENAHWEYGKVLFATINLPANNNHFRPRRAATASLKTAWWPTAHGCTACSRWRSGRRCKASCCSRTAIPASRRKKAFAAAELPHQTGWLCRSAQANPHAGGKIQGKVLLIDAQRGAAGESRPFNGAAMWDI
jgi:hypothetical protein